MNKNIKTTKNKISISQGSNIEQILSVISFHLQDIAEKYGAVSFNDVAFYFNGYNGESKFNIVDNNGEIKSWGYRGSDEVKKIKEGEISLEKEITKPIYDISYEKIQENVEAMKLRAIEIEINKKAIAEKKRLRDIEEERRKNEWLEQKRKAELERELNIKKKNDILNNHRSSFGLPILEKLKSHMVKTIPTALKYLGEDYGKEIKLPVLIIDREGVYYVYDDEGNYLGNKVKE